MTCTCPAPGHCPVFDKVQAFRHWQICRGEVLTPEKCAAYRTAWLRMKGGTLRAPLPPKNAGLSDAEAQELFGESDPKLIGDRIAALTAALGIPHCGGCEARREWLNKAHAWLRGR